MGNEICAAGASWSRWVTFIQRAMKDLSIFLNIFLVVTSGCLMR